VILLKGKSDIHQVPASAHYVRSGEHGVEGRAGKL
jgi:hypothetical protein